MEDDSDHSKKCQHNERLVPFDIAMQHTLKANSFGSQEGDWPLPLLCEESEAQTTIMGSRSVC